MKNKLNFNIKNLLMTPKERQMEKLKKFIERVTNNTNIRLIEFEITEGTYIPNNDISELMGERIDFKKSLTGRSFIFSANPNHPELNEKFICMTLDEVNELIDLYREALDMK